METNVQVGNFTFRFEIKDMMAIEAELQKPVIDAMQEMETSVATLMCFAKHGLKPRALDTDLEAQYGELMNGAVPLFQLREGILGGMVFALFGPDGPPEVEGEASEGNAN